MLNQTDMGRLLNIIMAFEHQTTIKIESEEYQAIAKLAKQVTGTPEFIIQYFEGKANA